jgi:hypothetical protein
MGGINMISIGYIPPVLMNKPGTLETFEQHSDEWIDSIEKSVEVVNKQIKPVTGGSYGFIHPGNYDDINTGQPITNFKPFFPDQNFIGSQVMALSYDFQLVPHQVPYPDITTGTPVGKSNFVNNPPVGRNLNTSV